MVGLAAALGGLTLGGFAEPAGAATTDFPHFTGAELKAFYYASLPLPGTQRITSRPPIYGHAGADRRIQSLAEQRGYRLQVTPTVSLGSFGGLTLAADAGQAWNALLDASRRHGTPLQGNSGYRSVATQREIFRRRLGGYSMSQIESGAADGAIESVLAYHSIPGYSRHHTGKTIDMSQAGGSNGGFRSSDAYQWLAADNYHVAKSFGFIPNYPPGAGAQGPNPEPWEFVYIGVSRIKCAIEKVPLADPNAWIACGLADRPLVGDLTADGIDDVFVYRAGSRSDGFFPGTTSRAQVTRTPFQVQGTYVPLVGDFRGDGTDDILWYAPGPAPDSLWRFSSTGARVKVAVDVRGTYRPLVGDFNGDGRDDIFWYGPGGGSDSIWFHRSDGSHYSRLVSVAGLYQPIAGDFNGSGVDDILWYGPGGAADSFWAFQTDGGHVSRPTSVSGSYTPVAGDFSGDGVDDIFWYAPGGAPDSFWYQRANLSHSSRQQDVRGVYSLGAGDHDGNGYDDIVFLAPPGAQDSVWFGGPPGFSKVARSY